MTERQVTLVCGPPCAGKSAFVKERAQPGDLVIDYDEIARRLGSTRTHGHEYRFHKRTELVIARALLALECGKHDRAWVIRSLPVESDRQALAQRIGAEVVVLDEPDEVLHQRASERRDPVATMTAISEWRARSGISPDA
jgi:predicted kinase